MQINKSLIFKKLLRKLQVCKIVVITTLAVQRYIYIGRQCLYVYYTCSVKWCRLPTT